MEEQPVSPGMALRSGLRAGELTVYGSPGCTWTRKQRQYLDQKKLSYSFVDCETQACPDFVQAYPTILKGKRVYTGFTEL